MKTALLVIAPSVFRDEEYAEPKRVLESRGIQVVTASTSPGLCTGKLGMVATAELAVHDALNRSWDCVAFIGGAGASVFFDDPDSHTLARRVRDAGALLSAICIAPSTLAHAGLLDGVRATAFPSQRDDLMFHGALWEDGPVVVDGTVVTANGPQAAESFGLALADHLGG